MARHANQQAEALAAAAHDAGLPQAATVHAIAGATGLSESQARRYASHPKPLATADQIERLCRRLEANFQRAECQGDFKAVASISKQLLDAYHRLDLARQADAWAHESAPF